MELQPLLVALAAGALLLWLLYRQWSSRLQLTYQGFGRSAARPPPNVPGLLLLGNVLSMRAGAAFIADCHKKYGDAFTLSLLGQRMTFLFAAPAIERYFAAPDSEISFGPAVQQFTDRIFGLPPKHFFNKHLLMLGALRDLLAPAGLRGYGATLCALARAELAAWPERGEVELWGAIQSLVFKASVSTLFGPAFLEAHGAARLQQAFFDFESAFELAASPVPHLLLPRFRAARARLVGALRASLAAGHFGGTLAEALSERCGLPEQYVPNMLLALLWASQANAVAATFWSLGLLLLPENHGVREELLRTLGTALQAQPTGEEAVLEQALDRRSLLVRCVIETLRLRSMSIDVRVAAADVVLPVGGGRGGEGGERGPGLLITKGSVVALSPYASHQDPRFFGPDASAFDPGRAGMLFGGKHAAHAVVAGVGGLAGLAFGGGKYRCPGRYFAELEVGVLLGLLLQSFDFQLLSTAEGGAGVPAGAAGTAGGRAGQHGGAAQRPAPTSSATGSSSSSGEPAAPGDPRGLLPPPCLEKLVGLKVPDGPCWVRFARR